MINGLDLFSGIGGISFALREWVRPIAYCENDRYAQAVLLSRMHNGELHIAPIWDDVRSLRAKDIAPIDIIYGGFPCQDISVAGTGAGLEGERSGLFFHIVRLVSELRPRFVFLENVPAITVRGLDRVLLEFTALGYDCRWTIVSAAEMGAPHFRERWFLLAHANGFRLRQEHWTQNGWDAERKRSLQSDNSSETRNALGDSYGSRQSQQSWSECELWRRIGDPSWWKTEPDVGRVADGVPFRVDCLRGLGNAVVPVQAKEGFKRLMGVV